MNLPTLALCAALAWTSVSSAAAFDTKEAARYKVTVTDGDTIRIGAERVRIENVDAPELGSRARCPVEARKALEAKAALERLVRSGTVSLVRNVKRPKDRYGRTLAVVLVDGKDVAPVLISEGLARPWKGRSSGWC